MMISKQSNGFSLVDLLISLFIVSLLLLLLSELIWQSKKSYLRVTEGLDKRLDLLWVTEIVTHSIRSAGFTPCVPLSLLQTMDTRSPTHKINGLSITNGFQISRMKEQFNQLLKVNGKQELRLTDDIPLKTKRSILIADCEHAEVHRVAGVKRLKNSQLVHLLEPLHFTYSVDTYVGEWIEEQWSIRKNPQGRTSLYYQIAQPEELSSQVNSMRLSLHDKGGSTLVKLILGIENEPDRTLWVVARNL